MMEWIKVSERLPLPLKMIIIATPFSHRGRWDVSYLDYTTQEFMVQSSIGWDQQKNYGGPVTHWLEIITPEDLTTRGKV